MNECVFETIKLIIIIRVVFQNVQSKEHKKVINNEGWSIKTQCPALYINEMQLYNCNTED